MAAKPEIQTSKYRAQTIPAEKLAASHSSGKREYGRPAFILVVKLIRRRFFRRRVLPLQPASIDDIFADGSAEISTFGDKVMGLFDSYDDTAFDEKDKVRLFETHSGRDGSANHYAKAFLAVTLFVVLAAAAVIYLLMPGVGDEIQGSQAMRRSVYDYMLSAEKRTATELISSNAATISG